MDLMNLVATLSLDSSKYEEGLGKAESIGGGFGKGLATAAKGVGVAVTALTTATAVAGGAFISGAGAVAEYGDEIDKMSQKMGLSAEKYQEWDAILKHSGSSMSAMKASMKTLANAAETGSDAFERLGLSQEEVGAMSQEKLFEATIAGLQNVTDTTERTYLAGKLLGRGATELGALLNTSAEDTEAMRQRVHELGGVMSDEAVKASARYQDSLQDMQTAISGIGRNLMQNFLPVMTDAMDRVSQKLVDIFARDDVQAKMDKLTDSIMRIVDALLDNLDPILDTILSVLNGLAEAIIFVANNTELVINVIKGLAIAWAAIKALSIISSIMGVISTIGSLVGAIGGVGGAIALLTNPITLIVGAVAGAAALIISNWDSIKEFAIVAWEGIKAAWSVAVNFFAGIGKNISSTFQKVGENLKGFFSRAWDGIKSVWNNVGNFFSNVGESILNTFRGLPSRLLSIGMDLMAGLGNGIMKGLRGVLDVVGNVGSSIVSFFMGIFDENSPSKITEGVGKYFDEGFGIGVEKNAANVFQKVKGLGDGITEAFNPQAKATSYEDTAEDVLTGSQMLSDRNMTVILQLREQELARTVFRLNNSEIQRHGVQLAGGLA